MNSIKNIKKVKVGELSMLWFILLLLGVQSVRGQETIMNQVNYNQLEQLIALANSHYPRSKISELAVDVAKEDVAMNKASWFDALGLNVNYFHRPAQGSDNTAVPPVDGGTVVTTNPFLFNGFQFGVNLRLGEIAQKPAKIRQAKVGFEIAKLEDEEYKKLLRNEVKARYYEYIHQVNEVKIRTQAAQDSKNTSDDVATSFERGEAALADYNLAKTNHAQANSLKIAAEMELLKAKDQLQELIGMPLEQVK